ncbi:hypothetical protein [Thermoanaerobacterium sp. DL9XJH110]|uniref:hypothetical protein n=1 Tax=Thermoanaerobacterium sp. DL9XJH110 TaxID=3386643 RepID=UPI003BB5385E
MNKAKIKAFVIAAAVAAAAAFYFRWSFSSPELNYYIKVSSFPEKQVEVRVEAKNPSLAMKKMRFYRGSVNCRGLRVDGGEAGEKPAVLQKDGFVEVETRGGGGLNLTYKVKLGMMGKHGHQGGVYEDLFVFDGDSVLIFPEVFYTGSDTEIKKAFKRVSVSIEKSPGLETIVPEWGKKQLENRWIKLTMVSPSWMDIYNLRQAGFALGKFEVKLGGEDGKPVVYADSGSGLKYAKEAIDGIESLYRYYSKLFKTRVPLRIVLLRKDPADGAYIMGGTGADVICSTFDPSNARDWQLLGHRMFHAFFDSTVKARGFHEPPQLWFYEGLATYYENVSLDSLPDKIKADLKIDVPAYFSNLFKRYLYMRLKDPYLLTIVPLREAEIISSPGKTEFLHYTQAPLIIKAVEDYSYKNRGVSDAILNCIMKNRNGSGINLTDILEETTGDMAGAFFQGLFNSGDILPLWYLAGENEDAAAVIRELNSFEHTMWSWFRLEIIDYPGDNLTGKGLYELSGKAEKEGVYFAAPDIEKKVLETSPTVYHLLKQYAMRAKVCGVDYQDPLLRFKLLNDRENVLKWERYISGVLQSTVN